MKFLRITDIKPSSFFLSAGLLFGVLYCLFVPPFQSPDEFHHFCRAYQVSEGHFIPEKKDRRVGGELPKSFEEFFAEFSLAAVNPDYKFTVSGLSEALGVELNPGNKIFTDFANTSYYSPVSYLPQALVMAVLRVVGLKLGAHYYVSRFVIFLLWLLAVHYCIRIVPVFKWLLVLLALLPMNLFIAGTFNADNVTNILSFLWIARVLRLALTEKQVTRRELIILVLIATSLALAKLVYIGLLALLMLIPRNTWGGIRRQFLDCAFIVLPALLLAFLWTHAISGYYVSYADYNPAFVEKASLAANSDYHKQMTLLLSKPAYFPQVIFRSIFNPQQYYIATYIGAFGAFFGYNLPQWLIVMAYLVILLVAAGTETKSVFNLRQKLIVLGAAILSFCLLLFTLHLIWDPVGSGYVWLIQGRYLIPILPMLFMVFGDLFRLKQFPVKWVAPAFAVFLNSYALVMAYGLYFYDSHAYILTVNSGFEETSSNGFTSSVPGVFFENQSNQVTSFGRSGKACAAVSAARPYGLLCRLGNVGYDDVIEVEAWKKGKGGIVIISGGGKNCKGFYAPNASHIYEAGNGWKKVHHLLRITGVCDSSHVAVSVYNPSPDTAYFDDLKLTVRSHKKIAL